MLARIKKISGVGRLNCGHQEFRGVTLVYGRNGAGKSTLADIMRSAGTQDPQTLVLRREIKQDGSCPTTQLVEMSFCPTDTDGVPESSIKYEDGVWVKTGPPLKIRVFDNSFVDANVFTGLKHEHRNRQALTSLLLGERAVAAASILEATQADVADLSRSVQTVETSLRNRVAASRIDAAIPDLLRPPTTAMEKIPELLTEKRSRESAMKKTAEATGSLGQIADLEAFAPYPVVAGHAATYADLSSRERPVPDTASLSQVREHLSACGFADETEAVSWLRTGWSRVHGAEPIGACPFCGQDLAPAIELMDSYARLFDDYVRSYQREMLEGLDGLASTLGVSLGWFERTEAVVDLNAKAAENFRPYIGGEEAVILDKFRIRSAELSDALHQARQTVQKLKTACGDAREGIKNAPSANWCTSPPTETETATAESRLEDVLAGYEPSRAALQALLARAKSATPAGLAEEVGRLSQEIRNLELESKRHEWVSDIERYKADCESLVTLKAEVPVLKAEVLKAQEEFVATYFKRVNGLLGNLTGKDFEVTYEKNISGTEPVYGLGLKYRGQTIEGARMPFTLSDGDRRSLALAIFIAALDHEIDKNECIILLDDPVASLDEHRRSETVRQIVRICGETRQVIVLSHYKSFLAQALRRLSGYAVGCMECYRDGVTSTFRPITASEIQATEYDRSLERLETFIDGEDSEVPTRYLVEDIRSVMETEVRSRYRRYLTDSDAQTLGKTLDHLEAKGALTGDTLSALRYLNEEVSELHHRITEDDDPDDARSVMRRALDLLYDTMVGGPNWSGAEPDAAG